MYIAEKTRYENMKYNRCGASGLKLPAVSLGLWHNFGTNGNFDTMMASHILIWQIIMAQFQEQQRKISDVF